MNEQDKNIFLGALDDARYRLKKAEERIRECEMMFKSLAQNGTNPKSPLTDPPAQGDGSNYPPSAQKDPGHLRNLVQNPRKKVNVEGQ